MLLLKSIFFSSPAPPAQGFFFLNRLLSHGCTLGGLYDLINAQSKS